ncbi:hypothetical protein M433DRAFT_9402 [Acidomyces richmondensis BFW]|nr:MAG: hypothetical protein FE78DRAFT_33969 [Acidomyces sp. 'richmondensis']KYG40023.1 hypothetical protein M433DRAFT_9402 [Acidomyces richmondensis BFW]
MPDAIIANSDRLTVPVSRPPSSLSSPPSPSPPPSPSSHPPITPTAPLPPVTLLPLVVLLYSLPPLLRLPPFLSHVLSGHLIWPPPYPPRRLVTRGPLPARPAFELVRFWCYQVA